MTAHPQRDMDRLIRGTVPEPGETDGKVDLTALAASETQEQIQFPGRSTLAILESPHRWIRPSGYHLQSPTSRSTTSEVRDVTLTKLREIDGSQVVYSFTERCEVELDVSSTRVSLRHSNGPSRGRIRTRRRKRRS